MSSLRDALLGSWRLLSFAAVRVSPSGDANDSIYPMSQYASGILIYSPDGNVSVQIMAPGAKPLSTGNPLTAPADELADIARRYFAYAGPFEVTEGADTGHGIVTHTLQLSSLPNILGESQRRKVSFEDGSEGRVLVIAAESPAVLMGEDRIIVLKWAKVEK